MKEIRLTIDGKEVRLTDDQLKMLGVSKTKKKRNNPFEKVGVDDRYYFISTFGNVNDFMHQNDVVDRDMFDICNYFNDKQFTEQVALHQLLYRKLLKFAYDNECEDSQIWGDNGIEHWHIMYDFVECIFYADWVSTSKNNDVYFSTKEGAERAIEEVVKPFMKEHPDFVW